ncbi:MAG: integration host factor subunit alpha [Legionellales bacterium]|nr:integration host factor subunit alpha [Legionellales bacterium]
MTITKADIAKYLSEQMNIPQIEAKEYIEIFLDEIKSVLEQGDSVKLPGFGTFEVRHKKSRIGGNLRAGETTIVKARSIVSFKAGKNLKAKPVSEDVDHSEVTSA